MKKNTDNIIIVKSTEFAANIVKTCSVLRTEQKEGILSKQLLRSGTSIGANIREAVRGQSSADFYAKLSISLKEASETEYWLELLNASGYLDDDCYNILSKDCNSLLRLLTAIIKHRNDNK